MVGLFSYNYYKKYKSDELKQTALKVIESNPIFSMYNFDMEVSNDNLKIKGIVPYKQYKLILLKNLQNIKGVKSIKDEIIVKNDIPNPYQTQSNIAYLLKGYQLNKNSSLDFKFDFDTLTLIGDLDSLKTKKKLLKELKNIKGVKHIIDKTKITFPNISKEIYFAKGKYKLTRIQKEKLQNFTDEIKNISSDYTIIIKAYSDMIGSKKKNEQLTKNRAKSIINYLKEHNFKNISSSIILSPPPGIDAKKEPDKARMIKIYIKEKTDDKL